MIHQFQSSPTLEGWALGLVIAAHAWGSMFQSSPTLEGWALEDADSITIAVSSVSILAHP